MKTIDDGGPAFPFPTTENGTSITAGPWAAVPGMSLRDYLAAKADPREIWGSDEALPLYVAEALLGRKFPTSPLGLEHVQFWADALAAWKYLQSDAMIAASKRTPEGGAE